MLTVLNYGGGNLKSVTNMLDAAGFQCRVTDSPLELSEASKIIFPGQGHFGQAMESLKTKGLAEALVKKLKEGTPFLGICIGLQVLFESSEEAPNVQGLGVFKGRVVRFTEGKIPQIGWNKIKTTASNSLLKDDFYYFVNSFYAKPADEKIISSTAEYHRQFAASVERDNIIATQFHLEKSGRSGQNLIETFIRRGF